MNIDEAIENSKEATVFLVIHHQDRLARSVQLGTEALKRVKRYKKLWTAWHMEPLPGETEG